MTIIPLNQGDVKLSEVGTDQALPLLATGTNEDNLTVQQRMAAVLSDVFQRLNPFLLSRNGVALTNGAVVWSGTTLSLSTNTDVIIKVLQGPNGVVTNLVMTYGGTNTATTFNSIALSDGDILYAEIRRDLLQGGGNIVLQNAVGGGSVLAGQTVRKNATMPPVAWGDDLNPSGTLMIPIAVRQFSGILWPLHGIFWPANTSSPLGAVITATTQPTGSIQDYTRMGVGTGPYGYTGIKALAPGYQLCDGSIVIDPLSPFRNTTRNDDGTPGPSFNAALDVFTPNLNGPPPTHSGANTYQEGDYVNSGGTYYVAIQAVPAAILISNTTYWQPESTYNNAIISNPYCKYRRTTQNRSSGQNIPSFTRGNSDSFGANTSSAYAGENDHALTIAELAAHDHGGSTGGATGSFTSAVSTASDGAHTHSQVRVAERDDGSGTYRSFQVESRTNTLDNVAGDALSTGSAHPHSIPAANLNAAQSNHTHSVPSQGSGTPHNNQPRYFNVLKLVKIY